VAITRITTPVTIINGRHDPVVPLANAEFLDARLPNSRVEVIEAGHFIWEEAPAEYAAAIAASIERTEMRAAPTQTETLTYDVFINEALQGAGLLANGKPKGGSPVASTLIYGSEDAVLTDPGFLTTQAHALEDWVAGKGRNLGLDRADARQHRCTAAPVGQALQASISTTWYLTLLAAAS
jgi:hypothetical protein